MYKETISKDELAELPLQQFEGELFLIENDEDLDAAVEYLNRQSVLGFDTETKPSFKRGTVNTVALLQLSTNEKAFLFRINKIGLPRELREILHNPAIRKVGVAIRDDIRALQRISNFEPKGFVELQDHVKEFGIQNFGLKNLTGIVLGFRISKSQRLSNWESPELTLPQQYYAATDAWVSYLIFHSLNN